MKFGRNVINFGPEVTPDALRASVRWAEQAGFQVAMLSDHVAVTPDVAQRYPAPFYEPFTSLAWLAGLTSAIELGTTVVIVPYRHPLLIARMAANLDQLCGGRLVLGIGAGWARAEFDALGVPLVWNTWVMLAVGLLLRRFPGNGALRLTAVLAGWHTIEHAHIFSVYLSTGLSGTPGLLAQGGALFGGLPLSRADLHCLYNIVESVPMFVAFFAELRRSARLSPGRPYRCA